MHIQKHKQEYRTPKGTLLKVGDLYNGILKNDTCGAYICSIEKSYGRWRIVLKAFKKDYNGYDTRVLYGCDFEGYCLTKVS